VNVESKQGEKLRSISGLLNTWSIPNDTRQPVDELPGLFRDRQAWDERMPDLRFPRHAADRRAITELRDKLRASLSGHDPTAITGLVAAQQWRLAIDTDNFAVRWSVDPASSAGDALVIVVDAIVNGTWLRMRACPDCQWVFYDTSRNAQRTWCSMTAAGGARGCGSIAKTRAYRQRQQAKDGPPRKQAKTVMRTQ
jgi:hypothetical protein